MLSHDGQRNSLRSMIPISLYLIVDTMNEEIKKIGTNIKCKTGIKMEKVAIKNKNTNALRPRFNRSLVDSNRTEILEFVIH